MRSLFWRVFLLILFIPFPTPIPHPPPLLSLQLHLLLFLFPLHLPTPPFPLRIPPLFLPLLPSSSLSSHFPPSSPLFLPLPLLPLSSSPFPPSSSPLPPSSSSPSLFFLPSSPPLLPFSVHYRDFSKPFVSLALGECGILTWQSFRYTHISWRGRSSRTCSSKPNSSS